jgi:hypothetical protein
MGHLITAADRIPFRGGGFTGLVARRGVLGDGERHAVEVDDDGRVSAFTIAGETYEPAWLRTQEQWDAFSSMGACTACWYESLRRRDCE